MSPKNELVDTAEPLSVLLIHGTFARDAAWCKESSKFRGHLSEIIDSDILIDKFEWTGSNSNYSRLRAGIDLAEFIKQNSESDRKFILVGHSHGGNVIRYALRDEDAASRVSGVVTMATPFLEMAARPTDRWLHFWSVAFSYSAVATIIIGGSVLVAAALFVLTGGSGSDWNVASRIVRSTPVVVHVFVPIALAALAIIGKIILRPIWNVMIRINMAARFRQEQYLKELAPISISGIPLLVTSVARDEAQLVLSSARGSSEWLFDLIKSPIIMFILLLVFLPFFIVLILEGFFYESEMIYVYIFIVLIFLITLPLIVGLYLILTFLAPAPLRSLAFGSLKLVDDWLVDTKASPTPNRWQPMNVVAVYPQKFSLRRFWAIRHSRIYQTDEIVGIVAKFVKKCRSERHFPHVENNMHEFHDLSLEEISHLFEVLSRKNLDQT